MKDNIDYIVFSLKQAIEAESFGFTRNECCRNLKTALHQFWQNKTLGLHGQSQKKNIPRSKAALEKNISECEVEHVIPLMYIVNMLMETTPINKESIKNILDKYFHVLLVTKEEHNRLNASGLRSTMPEDWDGENIWARYEAVGIKQAKNQPSNTPTTPLQIDSSG